MSPLPPPQDDFDFADWLKEFGHGATNRQMTKLLRDTVAACKETGKKGAITLKLTIGAADNLAELAASITAKRPESSLPGGSYYVTEDGGLVEDDPRQQRFPTKILAPVPIKRERDGGAS